MDSIISFLYDVFCTWVVLLIYSSTMYISIPFITGLDTYVHFNDLAKQHDNKVSTAIMRFIDTIVIAGDNFSTTIRFRLFTIFKDSSTGGDTLKETYNIVAAIESLVLFTIGGVLHFIIFLIESCIGSIIGVEDFWSSKTLFTVVTGILSGNIADIMLLPVSILLNVIFYSFIFGVFSQRMYSVVNKPNTRIADGKICTITADSYDCEDAIGFTDTVTSDSLKDTIFNLFAVGQGLRSLYKEIDDTENLLHKLSNNILNELYMLFYKFTLIPKSLAGRASACGIYYSVLFVFCFILAVFNVIMKSDIAMFGGVQVILGETLDSCVNTYITMLLVLLMSIFHKDNSVEDFTETVSTRFTTTYKTAITTDAVVKGYVTQDYSDFWIVKNAATSKSDVVDNKPDTSDLYKSPELGEDYLHRVCTHNNLDYETILLTYGGSNDEQGIAKAVNWVEEEIHKCNLDPVVKYL